MENGRIAASFAIDGPHREIVLPARFQQVADDESSRQLFRPVDDPAPAEQVDNFQQELLRQSAVVARLAVDRHRVGRDVDGVAVRHRVRFAGRQHVEDARVLLLAYGVPRPAHERPVVLFRHRLIGEGAPQLVRHVAGAGHVGKVRRAVERPMEGHVRVGVGLHLARHLNQLAPGHVERRHLARLAVGAEADVEGQGVALAVAFVVAGHAGEHARPAPVDFTHDERLILNDGAFGRVGVDLLAVEPPEDAGNPRDGPDVALEEDVVPFFDIVQPERAAQLQLCNWHVW